MKEVDAVNIEKPVNPWFIAFIVTIATFMEVLDTTIVNVALNHIAGNLSASHSESAWVITSYLLTNAIVLPISGWLANVFGRKRYFLASIACFTISSFFCGAAESMMSLVFFRLIQGLSGGGLQPIQQAIILDTFPVHMRGLVFSITAITIIVAPILGPTFGGFITDNFSWRWIFYINIPVGIAAFLLNRKYLQDPEHAKAKGLRGKKIDFIGLGFIFLCLASLQILLDKGEQENWFESDFICILALLCISTLILGVRWLLKQEEPFIEVKLLKIRSFGISCVMGFLLGYILYSCNVLLPLLVQTQFGYSAMMAGLVLSPGAIVMLLIMPLMGKVLINKIYAKYLIAFGFFTCSLSMYHTMHFSPQTDMYNFILFRILQTICFPFMFIPISTIAYMEITKEMNNKASALYALFRNIGGSVGVSLSITMISRDTQVHQNALSAHLSESDSQYQALFDQIASLHHAFGLSYIEAQQAANAYIYQELSRQSALLAYVDGFYFIAVLSLLMLPLAFLLPKNPLYTEKGESRNIEH